MDYTWDLSLLYTGFEDENIEKDMAALSGRPACLRAILAEDIPDGQKLEKLADCLEETMLLQEKLYSFASLSLATDAGNAAAQQLTDRLDMMSVEQNIALAALQRYVGGLTDLEALIAASPKLGQIDYALLRQKREAQHLPDESILPWLLKMSLNGGNAFSNLRDKLDATLMVDMNGEQKPLSSVRAMAYDPDAGVRKRAYEAELKAYKKIEIPMAACLNAIKGEALTMIEAEHFDSVLDQSLSASHMDRKTLDAMWQAIDEVLPAFRRYLRKKGALLGHQDGIPFYDLFAPLSVRGAECRTYTIEQCRELLVREMSRFSPEMGAFIDNAFEKRWIDVFPKEGKGGGAFCSGLHGQKESRVLTNFAGSFSDVSTIAHELGHAWHDRCMQDLPYMMIDTPMPLAETASIFNETLLAGAVMSNAGPAERLSLLEGNLMEVTQCLVDIYSRYLFETAVIEGKKDHSATPEELCRMMLDAQDRTYGDGLDKNCRHPYMWACKSHYYIPGLSFYNFPYAFGQLFGAGMYAMYQQEGSAFVPRYNKLLSLCGSMDVQDVARSVGIDVQSIDFWRSVLKVYTDEIDEFIRLADELMG